VSYENFVECEGTDRICTGAVVAEEKKYLRPTFRPRAGRTNSRTGNRTILTLG